MEAHAKMTEEYPIIQGEPEHEPEAGYPGYQPREGGELGTGPTCMMKVYTAKRDYAATDDDDADSHRPDVR